MIVANWLVEHVLGGVVSGLLVTALGYFVLHFEQRWPYWGRTGQATRQRNGHDPSDRAPAPPSRRPPPDQDRG